MTRKNHQTPQSAEVERQPNTDTAEDRLVKIASICIVSAFLIIVAINVYLSLRYGTPLIDDNLKSAFLTLLIVLPSLFWFKDKHK